MSWAGWREDVDPRGQLLQGVPHADASHGEDGQLAGLLNQYIYNILYIYIMSYRIIYRSSSVVGDVSGQAASGHVESFLDEAC